MRVFAKLFAAIGLCFILAGVSSHVGASRDATPGSWVAVSNALPRVPACLNRVTTGTPCDGLFLKAAGTPIVKKTSPNGMFSLLASPKQTKKAVACGSISCLYNQLDWELYGGEKGSGPILKDVGCQENASKCKITLGPGSQWTPVLVVQNGLPVLIYLLYRSGK